MPWDPALRLGVKVRTTMASCAWDRPVRPEDSSPGLRPPQAGLPWVEFGKHRSSCSVRCLSAEGVGCMRSDRLGTDDATAVARDPWSNQWKARHSLQSFRLGAIFF